MDSKYFEEIKAREQAATPRPWKMENNPKGSGFFGTIHGEAGVSFSGNRADNEFIAHARTDIPALIAEVERLQNVVKIQKTSCNLVKTVEAGRTTDENIALKKENATLKKALELACELLTKYTCFKRKGALCDYFIQQAQEAKK